MNMLAAKSTNNLLRQQRKLRGWSQKKVADMLQQVSEANGEQAGVDATMVGKWERGVKKPRPFYQEKLCLLYGVTADQLGFTESVVQNSSSSRSLNQQVTARPLDEKQPLEQELGDFVMAKHFDPSRRLTLQQIAGIAGVSLFVGSDSWERLSYAATKPLSLDEATLNQFMRLTEDCWQLTNGSEMALIEQLLAAYMPKIVTLAHKSGKHQQPTSNLASQGYLLSGILALDQHNLPAMERCCYSALSYAQQAENIDLQAAALKQLATAHLIAKEPDRALNVYQETLPFVEKTSPLLKSRIYSGLASAYARCGEETEAKKFLGLAHDAFPSDFEHDPSFLFADSGLSVLFMYEGLTYLDLEDPQKAWNAFGNVGALEPKIQIGELTQLEFINLHAKTAIALRDQELSRAFLEAGVQKAGELNTRWGRNEAWDVYQQMRLVWPKEPQIKKLVELFK